MESKSSVTLRSSLAPLCLALASCTTVYESPTVQAPSSYPIKYTQVYPHDPAAAIVAACDQLRLLSQDSHRLCVMRGIDRLQVRPEPLPQGSCATGVPCGAAIVIK